jgi:aspartate aminotransferase-like enzyme/GNAT superfamily N-acetyltransferase
MAADAGDERVSVRAGLDSSTIHGVNGLRPAEALRLGRYVFKAAETSAEHEQLHRLNYETFVREVPQHDDTGDGKLVDKFHDKNRYFVALEGERVVGMLSAHDRPPFSIADKLADPGLLDRIGPRPLEVRLLAVEPRHRNGVVFSGLCVAVLRHAQRHGYSHMLISGVADRLRLYERMGFESLGPAVQQGGARFVPMVARVDGMPSQILDEAERLERKGGSAGVPALSLTPGHSQLAPEVLAELARPGIDHRSAEFAALHAQLRGALADLVGGAPPALYCGSGTLANDVVAATLAADRRMQRGLVLVNGEFGRRLAEQAGRFGLSHQVLSWDWGRPWEVSDVERALDARPRPDWIWAVHLESSTGELNDIATLLRLARERSVRVCLDCISSLGAVQLDLTGVHLATGVANKCLGGVAGLSLVYAAPDALEGVDRSRVPTYLDLAETLETPGPRFTLSSNLLRALAVALVPYANGASRRRRFARYDQLGRGVRQGLRRLGMRPLAPEERSSPVITTFAPPSGLSAESVLTECRRWGYGLGGGSRYLKDRGWLQIATMGDVRLTDVERLFEALDGWLSPARR